MILSINTVAIFRNFHKLFMIGLESNDIKFREIVINVCNEMELILKSRVLNKLMGWKVHHDGFKPTDSIEWRSVVAFVREREREANVNFN